MITIEEAVLAYAAAWNENDATKRLALLETCWADDGVILSNHEQIVGRAALFDRIGAWRQTNPADRGVFTSGIEQHHHWFRFTALVIRPDNSTYSEALDVGEVDPDGPIVRIITFFGPLPSTPTGWPLDLMQPLP